MTIDQVYLFQIKTGKKFETNCLEFSGLVFLFFFLTGLMELKVRAAVS